jgi:hypothetical protein
MCVTLSLDLRLLINLFLKDPTHQNAGFMKNDIRYAMRLLISFLLLINVAIFTASGQSPTGILKIFSDKPLVVNVDEVHYPKYSEIKLVPGTHWVKAINNEGERIYSQIVNVKADEVTSVLIEVPQVQSPQVQSPQAQTPVSQTGVVYGQTAAGLQPVQADDKASPAPEAAAAPGQTIDVGQIGGKLPADMSGAFGLAFGMNIRDVDQIMAPKAADLQRNTGYNVYAIPYESSVYLVECRFIDQKLFQIIVGYVSTFSSKSKLKLNKDEIHFPEFNRMYNDVAGIYGVPDSTEKIFLNGYSEDDGRILEALKGKKALILHTWTDEGTGNNIIMGLGYTTTLLAATIYTSGPLGAEAQKRKLKVHGYDYTNSFKENYFSK